MRTIGPGADTRDIVACDQMSNRETIAFASKHLPTTGLDGLFMAKHGTPTINTYG